MNGDRWRTWVVGSLGGGAVVAALVLGLHGGPEVDPLPPDPVSAAAAGEPLAPRARPSSLTVAVRTLSEADGERATATALADPTVVRVTTDVRYRVVDVRPHGPFDPAQKARSSDPCGPSACIAVTIYIYTDNTVLDALVDPGRWAVVGLDRGAGQPTLSDDEEEAAHRIAEANAEVRSLVLGEAHSHPDLASPMWPGEGPCLRDRCATVIFLFDDAATTGVGRQLRVLVDLSHERVLDRAALHCDRGCRSGWP